jgi:hypothetical protein
MTKAKIRLDTTVIDARKKVFMFLREKLKIFEYIGVDDRANYLKADIQENSSYVRFWPFGFASVLWTVSLSP